MNHTTLDLLDAWHNGDKDALVELVQRHAPWLRTYTGRRMTAKMRLFETSEDVVQTVLTNLLRTGPAFKPANEIQFRALIARAVYNRLCDLHDYTAGQGRDPDRVEPLPSNASRISIGVSSSDAPDRRASAEEERGFVALALQVIDPDDRRLIHWRDFEDIEFGQIAERLSMTEEGARSRYRRALARLRAQVEKLKQGQVEDLIRELETGEARSTE